MYVIDVVRESFMTEPVFACGHNEKQTLAIVQLKGPGWDFGERIELPGAHGEDVVRDLKFVDEGRVLSCGEDGKIRLWSVGQEPAVAAGADASAGSVSKKSKRKGKKEKERFAPY
jgi:hypothetical protein